MKQRCDPLRFLSRLEAARGGNDKKRWVKMMGEDVLFMVKMISLLSSEYIYFL